MVRCPSLSVSGPLGRRAPLGARHSLLGAALVAAVASVLVAPAVPALAATTERVEIVLEPSALPAADRERFDDRAQSIADAIASGLPLWRSFEPREVLAQTLARLAQEGVEIDTAIVNFDSLEADASEGSRQRLAKLGFVRGVYAARDRDPVRQPRQRGARDVGLGHREPRRRHRQPASPSRSSTPSGTA